ncbi:MAG TPA: hypothetical protein VMV83_15975 [Rectinemataceae bacterium]|nr:hypothetical protein [Rectinemataceae bacterium]
MVFVFSSFDAVGKGSPVDDSPWRLELFYGNELEAQYQNLFPKPLFGMGVASDLGLCVVTPRSWRIGLSYFGTTFFHDLNHSGQGASDSLKLSFGREWCLGEARYFSVSVEPQIGIASQYFDYLLSRDWASLRSYSRGPTWGMSLGVGFTWLVWEPLGFVVETHLAYRNYPDANADLLGAGLGLQALLRI